jgi:hypothetical protein
MKYIIALYQSGNKGKTQTLWHFAQKLISDKTNNIKFSTITENPKHDFTLIIEVQGEIVLIESQGDPTTNVYGRIRKYYLEFKLSIIFCATRTSGQTVKDVDRFAVENEFETIWTSTYQIGDKNKHDNFNILKANQLYDVLSQLKN